MKKRALILLGTVAIVGGITATLFNVEGKARTTENEIEKLEEGQYGGVKDKGITISEFRSVEDFVKHTVEAWKDDSDYRKIQPEGFYSTEVILSSTVYDYIDFFQKQIDELGMTEEFKAWQNAAYKFEQKLVFESEYDEGLAKDFENKMHAIASKLSIPIAYEDDGN